MTLVCLTIVIIGLIIFYKFFKTEKVYVFKEFNSKGQLIGTKEYVLRDGNAIIHGKFIDYNIKGIKISDGQFINGHIYGKTSYYYDNGKIEEVHFRKDKETTLESIFYNPKGYIEKYIIYDDYGNFFNTIYFDEKGPTNYSGRFQIEIYQHKFANKAKFNIKEDQYLKIGDTLKYSYIIANIPNAKLSFKIDNLSIDNSKVKRTQKNILPAQIDVKEVLIKKGKNTIRSIVRYEFNDKVTPVFTDTLTFDVNVN